MSQHAGDYALRVSRGAVNPYQVRVRLSQQLSSARSGRYMPKAVDLGHINCSEDSEQFSFKFLPKMSKKKLKQTTTGR